MDHDRPTEDEVSAWARLVRASRSVLQAIERELKRADLPPLSWYDAMLELRRAGEAGLRPQALQEAVLLEQYNISRLIDRLEAAGLVERRPCPEDRRGQIVHLTETGAETVAKMWPIYRRAIATHFADRLGPGEAKVLLRILGRVLQDTGRDVG